MSHISRIKTKIIEKEFLLKAIKDLGYEYEEGEFIINSYGNENIKAEIRIKRPLSSDIGFHKTGGAYEIVADWWGVRGIKRQNFSDQLKQRYAYQTTCALLEAQGFNLVEEEIDRKGAIRLVLRRME